MSKKSLFKVALEDIDPVEATSSDEIIADLAIVDQNMNEAVALQDQADQAEQTVEVIQQIEEAPTIEEKLEIAQEHLYSMIGLEKGIAFESHAERFNNAMTLAQEGIFSRFARTIELLFKSKNSILGSIRGLEREINGIEGGKQINEPGWGRSIFPV